MIRSVGWPSLSLHVIVGGHPAAALALAAYALPRRGRRPPWDRTPDAMLAGAELCAECDLPPQDLQWVHG